MTVWKSARVFADAIDSGPLDPRIQAVYSSALADGWADPTRLYVEASRAKALLDGAREEIAAVLGSRPSHTHFAPSPTVAAERIVFGIVAARRGRSQAIASAAESLALLNATRYVCPDGVRTIPIDHLGRMDIDSFERAITGPDIAFAAVCQANREVGTIQPFEEAYAAAFSAKVPLVVDATVTVGHLNPTKSWDALVANPSTWGGPGGMGILALQPELKWIPAWADDAPWAPGSTSIPAAVAAATALRHREANRIQATSRIGVLAESLRTAIQGIPNSVLLGHPTARMPHIVAATFVYADAFHVARILDRDGIAVGAGCSCGSQVGESCPVLVSMGAMTHGYLRFGLHSGLDEAGISHIVTSLRRAVERVRKDSGAPT